jgi:hypothetical protein
MAGLLAVCEQCMSSEGAASSVDDSERVTDDTRFAGGTVDSTRWRGPCRGSQVALGRATSQED